jgi:hypothetical protein
VVATHDNSFVHALMHLRSRPIVVWIVRLMRLGHGVLGQFVQGQAHSFFKLGVVSEPASARCRLV